MTDKIPGSRHIFHTCEYIGREARSDNERKWFRSHFNACVFQVSEYSCINKMYTNMFHKQFEAIQMYEKWLKQTQISMFVIVEFRSVLLCIIYTVIHIDLFINIFREYSLFYSHTDRLPHHSNDTQMKCSVPKYQQPIGSIFYASDDLI